ncbi:hypothetical protein [Deinococcus pimensis]|uniref:hypothetical protein n=1 Tax=Deinococcus pimensis TaxID=309888 RepID=UPI000480F378|nr:hypothetical protein [Deinococcus pimensis]
MNRPALPSRVGSAHLVLLLALTLGAAGAEGEGGAVATLPAATQSVPCTVTPLLLQVTIGNTDRGVHVAYQTPNGLWLASAAFQASEVGYLSVRATCDGDTFVLLRPEVTFTLDPRALTVRIDQNLALLPTTTLQVTDGPPDLSSALPLVRFTYDVRGGLNVTNPATSAREQTQFKLEYAQGPYRLDAAHAQAYASGRFTRWWALGADARLNPAVTAGLFATGADTTTFGVRASVNGYALAELPAFEVTLASDADIEVRLNNVTVRTFRAPAGRVLIQGLRPGQARGTVEVRWREGDTARGVTRPYDLASVYGAGSYAANGAVGWTVGRGVNVDATATLLLDARAGVSADVRSVGGQGRANLLGTYATGPVSFGLGGSLDWTAPELRSAVQGQVSWLSPLGTLGLFGTLAPGRPETSGVGVNVALGQGPWNVLGQVGVNAQRSTSVGASVSYHPTSRGTTTLSAEARGGRVIVALSGRYLPTDSSVLDVRLSPNVPSRVAFTNHIGPETVSVAYDGVQGGVIGYGYDGPARIGATFGTSGNFTAGVSGSLAWVGGTLGNTGDRVGATLLLHLGVPGVTVTAAGQRATSDAQGDVILTGLPSRVPLQVSVDLDELPIEIGLQSTSVKVNLSDAGVQTYDWRGNFTRSTWWQLRWTATEPAALAVLDLPDGQQVLADETGRVLLPPLTNLAGATIRDEASTRTCAVSADPTPGVLSCVQ